MSQKNCDNWFLYVFESQNRNILTKIGTYTNLTMGNPNLKSDFIFSVQGVQKLTYFVTKSGEKKTFLKLCWNLLEHKIFWLIIGIFWQKLAPILIWPWGIRICNQIWFSTYRVSQNWHNFIKSEYEKKVIKFNWNFFGTPCRRNLKYELRFGLSMI